MSPTSATTSLPPPTSRPTLWAETATLYRGRFLQGFTLADSPAYDDWQLWQAEQLAAEPTISTSNWPRATRNRQPPGYASFLCQKSCAKARMDLVS